MLTSPDPTTERGGLPWGLAALGLALSLVTVSLPWTARALADRPPERVVEAVAAPLVDAPAAESAEPAPYQLEPGVVIESAPPAPAPPPRPGVPARLVGPALGVDAPVIPIGAPGGVLLPPSDPQTLGWWSAGAQPGAATGGALITGHTVHSGGGAFDDLETLRRGDRVRVRTPHGVIDYAVRGVTIYRKSTLARDAERVFSQTVPGRLVLITCEDWNGSGYDSNAVVIADPA